MTIFGHFPIIPLQNSMAFKIWELQHDRVAYSNLCYNEVCYKGTSLYRYLVELNIVL